MASGLRGRTIAGLLVLCVALVGAATAGAHGGKRFEATVTEEFAFLGCAFPADPTLVDLCGSATTNLKKRGSALTTTVITGFAPLPSGCFSDSHETTLAFADKKNSTLVLGISGELCPTGGGNFTFTGTFTVSGGTGKFKRATGQGTIAGARQNGPVVSRLSGVLAHDDEDDD